MTDKTVNPTEDTDKTMPPDWAIEEAIKRACLHGDWDVDEVKYCPTFSATKAICLAARLIAQHEPPPVDPLVLIVRDILAAEAERRGMGYNEACRFREGEYDSSSQAVICREALKRGIEIGKADAS